MITVVLGGGRESWADEESSLLPGDEYLVVSQFQRQFDHEKNYTVF